jgi:radical SAM protein with 4Fe4S-binding SPASM domain
MSPHSVSHPWSVQIELVEGCNRICDFCGLNAIREGVGDYKFMTPSVAKRAASQIRDLCPEARIEFAMHGEPLMHPGREAMFAHFRSVLPKAQMQVTTNGRVIMKHMEERIERIFKAGIDYIVLDTYYPERDALREEAFKLPATIKVLDYYGDILPNDGPSPWHNHRRTLTRTVILMDDISVRDGESKARVIVNHAGNSPAKPRASEPLKKTCTLPFREITIAYNGDVNVCCQDWKHEYVCGNINTRHLSSIWNGPEFDAARAHLQNKDRSLSPCNVCDIGSGSRSGLLPKYPPVTDAQRACVVSVNAASSTGLVQIGRKA